MRKSFLLLAPLWCWPWTRIARRTQHGGHLG